MAHLAQLLAETRQARRDHFSTLRIPIIAAWIKSSKAFSTDLRVSAEVANHTPTLGLYYADYSSDDVWYLGNNMVLATDPARW
jgi:hypothetical protein